MKVRSLNSKVNTADEDMDDLFADLEQSPFDDNVDISKIKKSKRSNSSQSNSSKAYTVIYFKLNILFNIIFAFDFNIIFMIIIIN